MQTEENVFTNFCLNSQTSLRNFLVLLQSTLDHRAVSTIVLSHYARLHIRSYEVKTSQNFINSEQCFTMGIGPYD